MHEAGTGAEAIRSATLRPIDLVIVDLGLPDMDGSEVVERIRSWSSVPIIVLSVRSTEAEKVHLLELGADDYVVKPFGMAELLARVRVALRRQMRAASGEPTVKVGPLTIDLAARAVTLNGTRLTLTPKEYRLLQVLAQHAGNVVTHQHLLKEVWGSIHVHDTHYLRIFVRKLRQKIEPHPDSPTILVTELGVGYRLAQSAQEGDHAPPGDRLPSARDLQRHAAGPARHGTGRRKCRVFLTGRTVPRHKHGQRGPLGPRAFSGPIKPLKTHEKPTERSRSGIVRAPGSNTRKERCSQSSKPAASSTGLPPKT